MGKRVLIIGAGPGGLASAMLLAQSGVQVTILERRDRVGGRTSWHGENGYRFDLGPTFFLYPRVLEGIFASCGRSLRQEVEMKRLDPQYHLIFGSGGDLLCTPDVAQMEQQVARISERDAGQFRRFLDDNRVKLARFRPCLEQSFRSWRDVVTWPMAKLLPILRPWASIDQELGRYFTDPRIRLAFSFQSKYLGMSPFNCPSLFSILSFLEYEYGVWHPTGGCSAVSEAMARVARDLGVDIRLNEPVEGLLFEGRKVVGARTAEGEYRADALVINADFAQAMTKLVPDHLRRGWTDRKLAAKKYSCSTFMMYLGIEGRYDHLHHHTIYTSADYKKNLKDIEQDHVLSNDPSFYVHNPSVTDSTLAPAGHSSLYILVPTTHQNANVDWSRERDRYRKLTLEQLKKVGLHDLEGRIRYERIVTPADWENSMQIYRGATFSLAHNLGQMLHLRPRNRFEELPGVYLVGGGTHPGSGLPVIYESARISSRLLLQDLGLPWDACVVPDPEGLPAPWAAAPLPSSNPTNVTVQS